MSFDMSCYRVHQGILPSQILDLLATIEGWFGRMRIARIVQHFQPRFGYAEYYILREFQRQGHEVCIITSDRYSPMVRLFDGSGNLRTSSGRFLESGLVTYRLRTLFGSNNFMISQGMKYALEDFKPDVLHSNDFFYMLTLLGVHYKNRYGYKLFVDSITGTFNPLGPNIPAFALYKRLFAYYLKKNVDRFFAVCEGSKKWLVNNFSVLDDLISVVPLGADHRLFSPNINSRKITRNRLCIADDEIVLIYTGKMYPEKDLHVLVKSVAILSRIFPRLRLLIVGSGRQIYLQYLTQLTSSNNVMKHIIFHPTVEKDELPAYYNAADIGIWPGAPSISIVEAISTGLPVIIPKYQKPREDAYDTMHLLDYGNGLSFPRGDINELAFCIKRLATDESLRKEMGQRSRRLAEEKLNWESIVATYSQAYDQTVHGS